MRYQVEYRTLGGSKRSWEGEAENEDAAVLAALNASYENMNNDDHWHSIISCSRSPGDKHG